MKNFIYKICKFLILFLIINRVISIFIPYHWGNPWFSTKIKYLENNNLSKYNTFFFGSSRVYRQIDPFVFDTIVNIKSKEKIKSFNLGAPATFCPQTYYLYENFLNSSLSNNVKYCFIELMEVDKLGSFFMHQERTTYWQNFSDFQFIVNSFIDNPKIGVYSKARYISRYTISYIENMFHIGHFSQQLMTENYYDEKYIGFSKNGFFPLQLDLDTTLDTIVKNNLLERKNSLILNKKELDISKDFTLEYYKNISDSCDFVNLERIIELIEKSKIKNIHLIFVISPRNASQELINLTHFIPENNLLDMSNPLKYSKLYLFENSFDKAHLNTKGSIEYSRLLAIEFYNKNID